MKNFLIGLALSVAVINGASALDTAKIDNLTGLKGKLNEKEGVYRVSFPRGDVKVAVDGWATPAIHGARDMGGVYERLKYRSNGDGRYGSL